MMDIDLNLEVVEVEDDISHTNNIVQTSNAGMHKRAPNSMTRKNKLPRVDN